MDKTLRKNNNNRAEERQAARRPVIAKVEVEYISEGAATASRRNEREEIKEVMSVEANATGRGPGVGA